MWNDWIIDVLSDLGAHARSNNLPATAEALREAALVAAIETTSMSGRPPKGGPHESDDVSGGAGGRYRA